MATLQQVLTAFENLLRQLRTQAQQGGEAEREEEQQAATQTRVVRIEGFTTHLRNLIVVLRLAESPRASSLDAVSLGELGKVETDIVEQILPAFTRLQTWAQSTTPAGGHGGRAGDGFCFGRKGLGEAEAAAAGGRGRKRNPPDDAAGAAGVVAAKAPEEARKSPRVRRGSRKVEEAAAAAEAAARPVLKSGSNTRAYTTPPPEEAMGIVALPNPVSPPAVAAISMVATAKKQPELPPAWPSRAETATRTTVLANLGVVNSTAMPPPPQQQQQQQ